MRTETGRFRAAIMRDPGGYEWDHLELPPRNKSEDARLNSVRLKPRTLPAYVAIGDDSEFLYDPLRQEPALYRMFARLDGTEEAILDFACRYGDVEPRSGVRQETWSSVLRWRLLINEMKRDVEIAEGFASSRRRTPKWRANAIHFIQETAGHVPTFRSAGEEGGRLRLYEVCTNLVDAMKIQLTVALLEQKQFRDCQLCNKPFEVTPQVNRADRLFCSDNCRVKAYQRRKKQAIDLRRQGRSLRDIAAATDSDMESVKTWVADVNPKED